MAHAAVLTKEKTNSNNNLVGSIVSLQSFSITFAADSRSASAYNRVNIAYLLPQRKFRLTRREDFFA